MRVKTIAMYLPQFHEIPENNLWWGEGFTEWTTVRQGKALYSGHQQPKIPLDHNYYDLMDKGTMENQAVIAKQHGIYGFCFYHYWFDQGRKILEKPAENLLAWSDIEMPFCFCWANQTWARTWSNIKNANAWSDLYEKKAEKETESVLLCQKYGRENLWKTHFEYLLPFFRDKRYIRIDGKPLMVIYKSDDIYSLSEMIDYWNSLARLNGFDGIYIIGENCTRCKRVDGVMLHQPMSAFLELVPDHRGIDKVKIYDYESVWKKILASSKNPLKKTYFMGFVGFDDSPRRGRKGTVVESVTATTFGRYFGKLMEKSEQCGSEVIFVNAWNEWGEGMYLEPDEKNGFDFLEVHRQLCETEFNVKAEAEMSDIKNGFDRCNKNGKQVKAFEYYRLLNQWMYLKERGRHLEEYLVTNGIVKVVIYGYGDLGKHLLQELDGSCVEVVYIIDKNENVSEMTGKTKNRPDSVDAIIVTPFLEFEEIAEFLHKQWRCKVISIEELIMESL
jgi:hypothetical protein